MQLTVEDLSVIYESPDGSDLPALGPLHMSLQDGSFVCLLGPSGCGKSTLIRVIAGLQKPSSGQAWLGDQAINEPSAHVGLMFQDANLMDWRTVQDNISLPLEVIGIHKKDRHESVHKLLPLLGLDDFAHAYPGELSGGMAQRVALGRVLIQEPELLLLDEPFGALDALTREQISLDLLRIWAEHRQTVLMVTHNIQEAVTLADRILVMSRRPGQIIADIPVTLPRPRSLDMIYTEAFTEIAREVRMAIDTA